ncbi:MAG TPA: hypothetical protein VI756_24675 [Blastocatellia bacterium]
MAPGFGLEIQQRSWGFKFGVGFGIDNRVRIEIGNDGAVISRPQTQGLRGMLVLANQAKPYHDWAKTIGAKTLRGKNFAKNSAS